jgi:hypothetical protein
MFLRKIWRQVYNVVHVNTGSNRKVGSESDLLKPRLDNITLDVVTKTEIVDPAEVW